MDSFKAREGVKTDSQMIPVVESVSELVIVILQGQAELSKGSHPRKNLGQFSLSE